MMLHALDTLWSEVSTSRSLALGNCPADMWARGGGGGGGGGWEIPMMLHALDALWSEVKTSRSLALGNDFAELQLEWSILGVTARTDWKRTRLHIRQTFHS